jgi:hypothetical protein
MPAMNVHWKKPEQKFDAAFKTISRIIKFYQRTKQKLHIYFSLELGRLKICACTESTDLIVKTFKKNIHLVRLFL